jgi:acyl-coenzyme A thioesterase PaaI-like protein
VTQRTPRGRLEPGAGYTTSDLQVRYIRGISSATGLVLAEGTVVHGGRRAATATGWLFAESDGALLAHGTTGCLIMR